MQDLETGFIFESSNHIRYEAGENVSGLDGGARRAVELEPAQRDASEPKVYRVTLYNLDETHPVWRDDIQMAPKRMVVVEENESTSFYGDMETIPKDFPSPLMA